MPSEIEQAKQEILEGILRLSIQNAQLAMARSQVVGVLGNGNISAHHDINVNMSNCSKDPQLAQPAQESLLVTHFNLRCPSDYFTGRQSDLDTLDQKMTNCLTQTKLKDKTVVISGLGGVGKTEIVREYATKTNKFKYVIVIDASSSKSAGKSFKDIAADVLNLPSTKTDATITSVYRYFARKTDGETLFIFENAEETGFLEFLPTTSLGISGEILKLPVVLIISRHTDWTFPKRNQMYIHKWEDDEAVQYLTLRFEDQKIPVTENVTLSMRQLGNSLHCYPLGLTIAISNILKDQENSAVDKIRNYLRAKEEDHDTWRVQGMRDTAPTDYKLTMDTVFNADIRNIHLNKDNGNGVKALKILRVVSKECPVHPGRNPQITSLEMRDLCAENEIGTDVVEALRILYKYSIFVRHINEEGELLSSQIHDIIQLCKGKWSGGYLHEFFHE